MSIFAGFLPSVLGLLQNEPEALNVKEKVELPEDVELEDLELSEGELYSLLTDIAYDEEGFK